MKIIADSEKLAKDRCSQLVVDELEKLLDTDDSMLYYQFPLYKGEVAEDTIKAQLMLVSSAYGVFYFKCINENRSINAAEREELDALYANIFSRVNKDSLLRKSRRELKINIISSVIICTSEDIYTSDEECFYTSISNLKSLLAENKLQEELNEEECRHLFACIDGTKFLTPKKERRIEDSKNRTKATILDEIQRQEAVFDFEQKKVAFVTIDGPQRIRGLAGSGKTIILTMKAALYHLQYPEEEIVYTYYTKSLYGMIKNLIERYYRNFSDNQEPNWNKIHILHGWGGSSLHGVYYQACIDNGITPLNYVYTLGHNMDPFDYACSEIIKQNIKPAYDLTLIDEGQDFPSHFYQLCYKLSKNKKIVWAYDDFQNIFDIKIQDKREMFGIDENNNYYVDFSRDKNPYRDIILHTCYRNPRNILVYAFSLGLGIYNKTVLQRFSDNSQWEGLGFKVEKGDCSEVGSDMVISRPKENTPSYLSSLYGSSVLVKTFENLEKECEYVANLIVNDIQIERLRPDDICVICLDGKNIERYYNTLSRMLLSNGIRTFNLLNAPYSNTQFFHEGYITLATLNKAKGNEAGMVYIIGADAIFGNPNNVLARNRLFTAITRAKGWCVITGEGKLAQCVDEMQKLKEANLKLCFTQPSEETTKTIENVSQQRQQDLKTLTELISNLESSGMDFDSIIKYAKNKGTK